MRSKMLQWALVTGALGAAALACTSEVSQVTEDHPEEVGATADRLVARTYLSRRTPAAILQDGTNATGRASTALYYRQWRAPATLEDFKREWGFKAPGADIAGAVYFNGGDLGFGREMHCVGQSNGRRACYVVNYGTDAAGRIAFGGDAAKAVDDAARRQHPFATVAMIFDPGKGDFAVQFVAYGADGRQALEAQLDSVGFNKSIPYNCTNCHGGKYNENADEVENSHFLPFDLASFKYAPNPGYRRADQENELRRLNEYAYAIAGFEETKSQAIRDLVDGWYGGSGNVSSSAARFNDNFVPFGWLGHEQLYRGVVAPYCRGCHVAAGPTFDTFVGTRGQLQNDVCTSFSMPLAEVTLLAFWNSRAPSLVSRELGVPCAPPDFLVPPPPAVSAPTGGCLYKHNDTGATDSLDFYGRSRGCNMGNRNRWSEQCRDQRSETEEVGCVQTGF